jgi:hypothetical protein
MFLSNEILIADEAIVDVGASNVETFLMLMSQYAGSHKDYDYYIIPTTEKTWGSFILGFSR